MMTISSIVVTAAGDQATHRHGADGGAEEQSNGEAKPEHWLSSRMKARSSASIAATTSASGCSVCAAGKLNGFGRHARSDMFRFRMVGQAVVLRAIGTAVELDGAAEIEASRGRIADRPFAVNRFQFDDLTGTLNHLVRRFCFRFSIRLIRLRAVPGFRVYCCANVSRA